MALHSVLTSPLRKQWSYGCRTPICRASTTRERIRWGNDSNSTNLPNLTSKVAASSTSNGAHAGPSTSPSNTVLSASSSGAAGNASEASATASSSGVVLGATATPIANTTLNGTSIADVKIDGLPIQPEITPALAVAGAILILTGAFYTLIGIKTKWLHIFLSTTYLFSLAVTVLIIYVMHPPVSDSVQGAYLVAACLTGTMLGAVAVIFADITEGLGCFLGGFCLSMWFLVLKSGGLVTSTVGKVVFIACFTVGTFTLYISHYTRPYGLIGSTSFAGATAVVLGIDCFSRAGLKEFWLYIWGRLSMVQNLMMQHPNLSPALNNNTFPFHYGGPYPITRGIRVEIACTVLLFLLGIMSQMKVWKIVKQRREERAAEQLRRDEEQNRAEESLGRQLEAGNQRERALWDAVYGRKDKTNVPQPDSGIGTDEPSSTRKGSINIEDTYECAEKGMEMQNLNGSQVGSQDAGKVTVHVASDDSIVELPSASGQNSTKQISRISRESSLHESQTGAASLNASETSSVKTSTKEPCTLINPNLTLKPKFVPLPFKVPDDESQKDDDVSSVATFAASEHPPRRSSKRLSGSSLMRKLSGHSKQSYLVSSLSQEALANPHIEDDRRSSIAATLDEVSDHGDSDGVALSSRGHSPAASESKGRASADALVPNGSQSPGLAADSQQLLETGAQDPSEIQGQRAARASLAGKLPEGGSKVVMAYRTNEWAKHLEGAELPEIDQLKINEPRASTTEDQLDRVAPVNIQALQQTPLTAEPAPVVTNVNKAMGDRAKLPSMNRSSSATSNISYIKQQISRESLIGVQSREDLPRPHLPKARTSQLSIAPSRGFRSSSSPLLNTPLAESPIEEGVESFFPARFTPSPMHLMSHRDTLIRNKSSSTSLIRNKSIPSLTRNSSSNFANAISSAHPLLDEDDTVSLAQRKSILQQQQQQQHHHHNQPRRTSQTPQLYPSGTTTPQTFTRSSSRQSLNPYAPPRCTATLSPRDSSISSWHASLQPSRQATTQQQELDARRGDLLAEKRRASNSQQQAQLAQERRTSALDRGMRSGSMLDAHREAMRRMQGAANESLNPGGL